MTQSEEVVYYLTGQPSVKVPPEEAEKSSNLSFKQKLIKSRARNRFKSRSMSLMNAGEEKNQWRRNDVIDFSLNSEENIINGSIKSCQTQSLSPKKENRDEPAQLNKTNLMQGPQSTQMTSIKGNDETKDKNGHLSK